MEYFEIASGLSALIGDRLAWYFLFLIAGGVYLIFHILLGIGLYTLAKRAGLGCAWVAFVPIFNDYLIGKLAGECSLFGRRIKHGGIYYAVSEGICCVAYGLSLMTQVILNPYIQYYDFTYDYVGYPESLNWVYTMNTVLDYVTPILRLVCIVFTVVVLFAFFRKYAARNAWVFLVCSVFFPVKGAFVFAIRHNAPVDYERYMRAQREEYYRRQQQYYNERNRYGTPPDSPYNNNGSPYGDGRPPYNGTPPDDPFEEFSGRGKSDASEEERSENDEFFK